MQRYIVLDNHTLGVILPTSHEFKAYELQILRASVLRGSPYPKDGLIPLNLEKDNFRPATEQDFKDFNVSFGPEAFETLEDFRGFIENKHSLRDIHLSNQRKFDEYVQSKSQTHESQDRPQTGT